MQKCKKIYAFVALGCVIKGKTPHFDYIIRSTFDALIHISMKYKKPVGNGIITALNKSQATSRSSNMVTSNLKNKGLEAAKAVIEIIKKWSKIAKDSSPRVRIIQKIYGYLMNPDQDIMYPKII